MQYGRLPTRVTERFLHILCPVFLQQLGMFGRLHMQRHLLLPARVAPINIIPCRLMLLQRSIAITAIGCSFSPTAFTGILHEGHDLHRVIMLSHQHKQKNRQRNK